MKPEIPLLRNYAQSLWRALVIMLTGSVQSKEFLEWLNDYFLLSRIVLHGVNYSNYGIYHQMNFNPLKSLPYLLFSIFNSYILNE